MPLRGSDAVLVNGARMVHMCGYLRRERVVLETSESTPPDSGALDAAITHVAVVQGGTTSGVLDPVEETAAVTARRGRRQPPPPTPPARIA